MKTFVLLIHEEEEPSELINKYTDYNPEDDPYYVGFIFGGYDWVRPIKGSIWCVDLPFYNKMLGDTVKVKDFPLEQQKEYIHEIIDNNGDSIWWDEASGNFGEPSEANIENVFNGVDKELYCTLCIGCY
jgi:hypothetical protein